MALVTVAFWAAWALILYTYVGFPLLLEPLARLFGRVVPPEQAATQDLPRVVMMVAAHNEEKVMAEKLANTWLIDYPADRFEILVGSDGSEDCTNAILSSCADPRLKATLFPERRGKISVLNDLMKRVDADIVVMSDASSLYAPDAVRLLVRHFRNPRVGAVTGQLVLGIEQTDTGRLAGDVSGEGAYQRYDNRIKRNEGRLGCVIGCCGPIFAIRTQLYTPLPSNVIIEDFVLGLRVLQQGYLVTTEPRAFATDPPCTTPQEEMRRKIRIGAGAFQSLRYVGRLLLPGYGLRAFAFWGHKVLRWCVPFFILINLAAGAVLAARNGYYAAATLAQGLAIAASISGMRTSSKSRLARLLKPIRYFYLMNWSIFLGFLRIIRGKQSVTWARAAQATAAERS